MTNTESATSLLSAYEAAAIRIGYVEDDGIDGLVLNPGDKSLIAVYTINDLLRAEVRVRLAELVGDEVRSVMLLRFEMAPVEEVVAALDLYARLACN